MRCPLGVDESGELAVGYAARSLDPRSQAAFERHLKYCVHCCDAVAAQQTVWDALDEWRAVAVSPDFDRNLHRRIAHRDGWWRRLWRPAVPVAAASIVLCVGLRLGVAFWLHQTRAAEVVGASPLQASPSQVSPQIDKLEHALDDMDMLGQVSAGIAPQKADAASPI
jgi:anti-sigma-K factor RskA